MPSAGPSTTPAAQLQVIRADSLAGIPWLVHGFSTRVGGVSQAYGGDALNLGMTSEDTREAVTRNRELFLTAIGAVDKTEDETRSSDSYARPRLWPLLPMRQVHSSVVHAIDGMPHDILHGDGLITNRAAVVLAVRTADCLPVLVVDPAARVVGAFHAGWRGTLERIVEKGIGEMRRQFGSDPASLKAAIGPGIHRCCYEVSDELREKFTSQFAYGAELFDEVSNSEPVRERYPLLFMNMCAPGHGQPPRKAHLNLVEANRRQLHEAGVPAANIWACEMCTACRTDLFFSHRKERGRTGRMMSAVAISD